MKTIIVALVISLLTFTPSAKSLKIILKDCQLRKLPKSALMIGNEVISVKDKRYGYLAFQGPAADLRNWIKKSGLTVTSKKEIFTQNLMIWPDKRPTWFKESSDRVLTADIYYAKRSYDGFLTLCWIDGNQKVIHLEYEVRR